MAVCPHHQARSFTCLTPCAVHTGGHISWPSAPTTSYTPLVLRSMTSHVNPCFSYAFSSLSRLRETALVVNKLPLVLCLWHCQHAPLDTIRRMHFQLQTVQ